MQLLTKRSIKEFNVSELGRLVKIRAVIVLALMLCVLQSSAATYYVAPGGADTNPGTAASPFATIMRAQAAARYGDTVYLGGGTYHLDNSNLTTTDYVWAVVNNITKSGISYLAQPNTRPVFDFSNVKPVGYRVTAFLVKANHCVFRGFDVVGVQVTIQKTHTQSECFRIAGGSDNLFENLRMHDGMGIGWYLTSGASNLVLNCDAYNNRGLDSGSIGNIDGFGCHPNHTTGTGNVIRGCRAWFNSDDGYDCINAFAPVTFDHCWAYGNGYWTNFAYLGGDGNGFKAGGYGRNGSTLPNPVPRHVVEFCLSVHNRANGFYANHHAGGDDWFNNTAIGNGIDFNMLCVSNDNLTDVPGFDQLMKNNLGCDARSSEVANLGTSNDVTFNFFSLPVTVNSKDFLSLDESLLTLPRQTNGDLPYVAFAQLTGSSDLVDAGTNVGFAYVGSAPDLGAFERGAHPPPTLTLSSSGTSLILTGNGGPAGGPDYILSSANLTAPPNDWNRIATNQFDAQGKFVYTNTANVVQAVKFFELEEP